MKVCSICQQTYSDDLTYCLEDGTTLTPWASTTDAITEDYEQPTVVRSGRTSPVASSHTEPPQGDLWVKVAAALLVIFALLVLICGAAVWFFWPRITGKTDTGQTTPTPTPVASPTTKPTSSPQPSKSPLDANVFKGNDNNETPANANKTPDSTPTPDVKDPGPARITFDKGGVGQSVSGTVAKSRSYMLRTLDGQQLMAALESPNRCVTFTTGETTTTFDTLRGDSYINIRNSCDKPAKFTLHVAVR